MQNLKMMIKNLLMKNQLSFNMTSSQIKEQLLQNNCLATEGVIKRIMKTL